MNHLHLETSPYLLQHKDNPVHWHGWNDAAFEAAKAQNKPILLSVGYTACHWCHVMAHESFEDATTAAVMNDRFINIKLDREERPDLDALFQQTLALMGLQGGWPLTMFLTPDGEPFYGGTYFPPEPRHGIPAFQQILRGVADSWETEPEKILHNKKILLDAIAQNQSVAEGRILQEQDLAGVAEHIIKKIDPANGGFGGDPKFPSLPTLRFLWDHHIRTGDARYRFAVEYSLTSMCQGGIYDHIGGGFHRYTVDDAWLVPHFEKMLYDNALFISLLSDVYRETQNPLFKKRVLETVVFLGRDLGERDAFICSLDADSEGHEGKFYTWHEDDIDDALQENANLFKKTYDISRFGNWENINIPNRLQHRETQGDAEEQALDAARAKLFALRATRIAPERDDKILADLNGMAIDALVTASTAFGDAAYLAQAKLTFDHVCKLLNQGSLKHSSCKGTTGHDAFLDDYAWMIKAALSLYTQDGDQKYLNQATIWADTVLEKFSADTGGFYTTAATDGILPRLKTLYDLPHPCGNSIMAENLLVLHMLTDKQTYQTALNSAVKLFSAKAASDIFATTTFLSVLASYMHPISVELPRTMAGVLQQLHVPHLFVKQTNKPQAVVCAGNTCLPPIGDADALIAVLKQKRLRKSANDG